MVLMFVVVCIFIFLIINFLYYKSYEICREILKEYDMLFERIYSFDKIVPEEFYEEFYDSYKYIYRLKNKCFFHTKLIKNIMEDCEKNLCNVIWQKKLKTLIVLQQSIYKELNEWVS